MSSQSQTWLLNDAKHRFLESKGRNEALIRLRNSTVSLVVLFVTTHLLPLPSLWTVVNVMHDGEQLDTSFL